MFLFYRKHFLSARLGVNRDFNLYVTILEVGYSFFFFKQYFNMTNIVLLNATLVLNNDDNKKWQRGCKTESTVLQ